MKKLWVLSGSEYDLIETYLNDMSEEGYAFKGKALGLASFEKKDTKEYVFATAHRHKHQAFDVIKEAWEDEGWEYLCRIDNELVFRSRRNEYCKRPTNPSFSEREVIWNQYNGKVSANGIISLIVIIAMLALAALIIQSGTLDIGQIWISALLAMAALANVENIVKWRLLKGRHPEEVSPRDMEVHREHIDKISTARKVSIIALIGVLICILGVCLFEMEFYTGLEYGPVYENDGVTVVTPDFSNISLDAIPVHRILDVLLTLMGPIIKILIALGAFAAIKKKADEKKSKKEQEYGESDMSRRIAEFREAREAEKIRKADNKGERIDSSSQKQTVWVEDENGNVQIDIEDVVEEGEYYTETEFDPGSWDLSDDIEAFTTFIEKDLELKGVAKALKNANLEKKAENMINAMDSAHKNFKEKATKVNKARETKGNKAMIFVMFAAAFVIAMTAFGLFFSNVVVSEMEYEYTYMWDAPGCTVAYDDEPEDEYTFLNESIISSSYGNWYCESGNESCESDYGMDFEGKYYDYLYINPAVDNIHLRFAVEPTYMELRVWDRSTYEENPDLTMNYTVIERNEDYSYDLVAEADAIYCIYAKWDEEVIGEELYSGKVFYPFAIERIDY